MGRKTVYNNLTSEEQITRISDENKYLKKEFLDYLRSISRSEETISQYSHDLNIFFVWNLENNDNKDFVNIKKRDFIKFQNAALNDWGWSSSRIRRVKSCISSMSNFIENIMDEEEGYENYRSCINKIENPVNEKVREKTVFTAEELQGLLDKLCEDEQYEKACVLALAMCSGRRKAELLRFKVSYFDDENVVFGSLYKTPEKVKTKGRGKNGKLLELYTLKKPFDPYLKLWLKQREEMGVDDEYLFPNIQIETLNSWALTFSKILQRDFYWHSLRHYFVTYLSQCNIPSMVIKEIVGWEGIEMISVYDDRSSDEMLSKYFDENGIKQIDSTILSDL